MARDPNCWCISGPLAEGFSVAGSIQPALIGGIAIDRSVRALNMDTNGNIGIMNGDYPGVAIADGIALPSLSQRVGSIGLQYNGTNLRLQKSNEQLAYLASLARTATIQGADIINDNWSFAIAYLDVTAASGTGGLQVVMSCKSVVSGGYKVLTSTPAAIIAVGKTCYIYGIQAISNLVAASNAIYQSPEPLGAVTAFSVLHGDASSYTYSLSVDLLKAGG